VRLVLTSTTATAAHGSVLTITATAPGRSDRNKVVHVRVSDVVIGVGNVTVDFSLCAAEDRPVWFASQDGSGPWTQVIGAAGVYRFEVRPVGASFVLNRLPEGPSISSRIEALRQRSPRASARWFDTTRTFRPTLRWR
jgi:hypothetical protein